jgi:Tol biopolymer transport system component
MQSTTRIASIAAVAAVGAALAPPVAAAANTPAASGTTAHLTVAYLRDGDVYVATGPSAKRLTTDRHSARPRWSPDGTRLAYLSSTSLWVMDGDGSGRRRVAAVATGGASWSPDGRWLAYVGPDCNGSLDVLKVPATGAGRPVSLLPTGPCAGKPASSDGVASIQPVGGTLAQRLHRDSAVAWSPDGHKIAFKGGGCEGVFDDCLTVADIASGGETTVDAYGGGGQVFSGFGAVPAWRPDSARVSWTAYTEGDSPETSEPVHVVESSPAGAASRTIGTADDREMSYVNAGRAVLTGTHAGGSWITLVDLATGARTYLRSGSQPAVRP